MKVFFLRRAMIAVVLSTASASAASPLWWEDRVKLTGDPSPMSPATIGQIKNMAHHLNDEIRDLLPLGWLYRNSPDGRIGQDDFLEKLFPGRPSLPDVEWMSAQRAVANVGQLKHVGATIYASLRTLDTRDCLWFKNQIHLNGGEVDGFGFASWENDFDSDVLGVANLGQVKNVFSLRTRQDYDNDGLPDLYEVAVFKDLSRDGRRHDIDGDGISDWDEIKDHRLNHKKADSDGDGIEDLKEIEFGFDPSLSSDGEADFDGDGLSNRFEINEGFNPLRRDSDGDGMFDGWEWDHSLDPLWGGDRDIDFDGDGKSSYQEFLEDDEVFKPLVLMRESVPVDIEINFSYSIYSSGTLVMPVVQEGDVITSNLTVYDLSGVELGRDVRSWNLTLPFGDVKVNEIKIRHEVRKIYGVLEVNRGGVVEKGIYVWGIRGDGGNAAPKKILGEQPKFEERFILFISPNGEHFYIDNRCSENNSLFQVDAESLRIVNYRDNLSMRGGDCSGPDWITDEGDLFYCRMVEDEGWFINTYSITFPDDVREGEFTLVKSLVAPPVLRSGEMFASYVGRKDDCDNEVDSYSIAISSRRGALSNGLTFLPSALSVPDSRRRRVTASYHDSSLVSLDQSYVDFWSYKKFKNNVWTNFGKRKVVNLESEEVPDISQQADFSYLNFLDNGDAVGFRLKNNRIHWWGRDDYSLEIFYYKESD